MKSLRIIAGKVLTDAGLIETSLRCTDGTIGLSAAGDATDRVFNASGLLVLPGIVDIHGDAFERQLQPRPGVAFPTALALQDTQAQLLANGITTAFHGVTLSWEPGLRSAAAWRDLVDTLARQAWVADMRVHLRWEAFNLDALEMACADIATGHVHLVAFNDHTPSILRRLDDPVAGAKYSDRAGMTLPAFRALANRVADRAGDVPAGLQRIADAARAAALPVASHDDATIEERVKFRKLGARICEFPMAEAVGEAARAAGEWVVMGSPNVVRGGSHLGWASAALLAERGICNVLSSDYYYPALLQAAFILAERGVLDLAAAWSLISTNPAAAAGLTDRGVISDGRRADMIIVDPLTRTVQATVIKGQIAWLSAEGARRVRH